MKMYQFSIYYGSLINYQACFYKTNYYTVFGMKISDLLNCHCYNKKLRFPLFHNRFIMNIFEHSCIVVVIQL